MEHSWNRLRIFATFRKTRFSFENDSSFFWSAHISKSPLTTRYAPFPVVCLLHLDIASLLSPPGLYSHAEPRPIHPSTGAPQPSGSRSSNARGRASSHPRHYAPGRLASPCTARRSRPRHRHSPFCTDRSTPGPGRFRSPTRGYGRACCAGHGGFSVDAAATPGDTAFSDL